MLNQTSSSPPRPRYKLHAAPLLQHDVPAPLYAGTLSKGATPLAAAVEVAAGAHVVVVVVVVVVEANHRSAEWCMHPREEDRGEQQQQQAAWQRKRATASVVLPHPRSTEVPLLLWLGVRENG
jgi:hypothetical protein